MNYWDATLDPTMGIGENWIWGDEDPNRIRWGDYTDRDFAIEGENGEVLNMTEEFKEDVFDTLLSSCDTSEKELDEFLYALFMDELADDENSHNPILDDPRFAFLKEYDTELFTVLFGYNEEERTFCFRPIGYLECPCGFDIMNLLEDLGYSIDLDTDNCGGGVYYY